MKVTIIRNKYCYVIDERQLSRDDLVLALDGNFYPTFRFAAFNGKFSAVAGNPVEELLRFGFITLFGIGILAMASDIMNTVLSLAVNDVPLSASTRMYIRERDGELCTYCGSLARDGHVDHRISRANGGDNDPSNLAWACVNCNCTKGRMNDYEFVRVYDFG
jgi:hypothetical protein